MVTIEIESADSGSTITLTHELDPSWLRVAGNVEAGWIQMLDAMAAALAPRPEPEPAAPSPRA